jgi:hypothetical protein
MNESNSNLQVIDQPGAQLVPIQGGRQISVFERAATALMARPDASLDQLQQMMQMHERWEEREAEKAFTEAMTQFKEHPPEIIKDKFVGYENKDGSKTGYTHATLGAVCEAVIAGLAKVGISHDWKPKQSNGMVGVTCYLTHRMGHKDAGTYIEAGADTSGKKNAIQAVGSTITFLQRYTLLAAVGLAPKDAIPDDDGRQHKDPQPDWVDAYLEAVGAAEDLATLMAAWKTASGACRRKADKGASDEIKLAVLARREELGITPEAWKAAGEKSA